MSKLLLTLLLYFSTSTQAAWLALCDAPSPTGMPSDFRFNTADGIAKIVSLLDHEPPKPCISKHLPISADAVQWFALLSAGQAAQIEQSRAVVLQGKQTGKIFAGDVTLDTGAAAPEKPLPWPLFMDLFDHLDITPFGLEERASLSHSETTITFRCLAGQHPAGFVLHLNQNQLPQLPGLGLKLDLQTDGDFTWSASQSGSNSIQPLAKLHTNDQRHTQDIDLTPMLQPQNNWDSWVLLCPQTKSNLTLNAMQLSAPTTTPNGRATWLWHEADWRQADAALWEKLAKLNIATLYITIPLSTDLTRVADSQTAQSFISEADKRGIAVWAVTGDPKAVLVSEQESWLKRAQAYADYNRDAPKSARLKGVQYDIEPYLAPGYAQEPEVWKQAYVDTLAALRKASPLALDVAVPVWWAAETLHDKPLLEAMATSVDSVTVMDYRTNPWRIQQQALPFLSWGMRHNKPIRIALEFGAIAEETRLLFHRAETGNLWTTRVGDMTLLVRLSQPGTNAGSAVFNLTNEITVSGEAVSFHDRPDEMAKHLPKLEHALGAWPTFTGLALHEILTP